MQIENFQSGGHDAGPPLKLPTLEIELLPASSMSFNLPQPLSRLAWLSCQVVSLAVKPASALLSFLPDSQPVTGLPSCPLPTQTVLLPRLLLSQEAEAQGLEAGLYPQLPDSLL